MLKVIILILFWLFSIYSYAKSIDIEIYVKTLYSDILDRNGDTQGMAFWTSELKNGRSSVSAVKGFYYSKELQDKNISDETFINMMFHTFLGKEPGSEELNDYVKNLQDNILTKKQIFSTFAFSKAFYDKSAIYDIRAYSQNDFIYDYIENAYQNILAREPDSAGKNHWFHLLKTGVVNADTFIKSVIFSQEFTQKNVDDKIFAAIAYNTILNKNGTNEEIVSLEKELLSGKTRLELVDDLLNTDTFLAAKEKLSPLNFTDVFYSKGLTEYSTAHFAGSMHCAKCHSELQDTKGSEVSIDANWRSTMMANASKDPLWKAKVHSETIRNPQIKATIERTCSTCHTPSATTQAEFDKKDIKLFEDGFFDKNNSYHEMAMDGVSCSLCHQIQNSTTLSENESFSGNFSIDRELKGYRVNYGQYVDPYIEPMKDDLLFVGKFGEHISQSKLCAACHTLFTKTVDDEGHFTDNEFPEQTPYLEWEQSIYAQIGVSCQDCHMPKSSEKVTVSNYPDDGSILPREHFSKHYLVGGNVFMLTLMQSHIAEMGISATTDHMDKTIQRTIDMLKKAAKLQIGKVARDGSIVKIHVTVANNAGHKLPSGVPTRRVWIHLKVTDNDGKTVFESGKSDKNGKITANDADENNTAFEPHYDVIDSETKVQIYESIIKDFYGKLTYSFIKAADYIKDNRLLPKGFDKTIVSDAIAVKGSASNDGNFIGGSDTVLYKIDTKGFKSPFKVKAELLYQSLSFAMYQDLLKDKNESHHVQTFENYYETASNPGIEIVKTEKEF